MFFSSRFFLEGESSRNTASTKGALVGDVKVGLFPFADTFDVASRGEKCCREAARVSQ